MDDVICLDSDVLIGILKNEERAVSFLRKVDAEYCTTAINAFELWFGKDEKGAVERFLGMIPTFLLDENGAKKAADIQKKLGAEGKAIEIKDLLIGAVCITNGIKLLTFNIRHFERLGKFGLSLAGTRGKPIGPAENV